VARAVLVHCFDAAVRLLQPIVPFVTDQIWRKLPVAGGADSARHSPNPASGTAAEYLALAAWPRERPVPDGSEEFELVREAVVAIRQARADYSVPPSATVEAFIDTTRDRNPERASQVFRDELALISRLALRSTVSLNRASHASAAAHALLSSGTELVVPLGGVVDVAKECRRLRGELEQLEKQLASLRTRLNNDGFVSRAPAQVVEAERTKEREWSRRRDQLSEKVQALCGD